MVCVVKNRFQLADGSGLKRFRFYLLRLPLLLLASSRTLVAVVLFVVDHGSIIVVDGSSIGRPCSSMCGPWVDHGRPWSTMVDHGRPSSTMVNHGRTWSRLRRPWAGMVDLSQVQLVLVAQVPVVPFTVLTTRRTSGARWDR